MAVKPPALMPAVGHGRPRAVVITGTITIGASGVVSSFSCEQCASTGAVVKNAAAGRYDIVFLTKYRNIRFLGAPSILGPASASFGNTDANMAQWRPATSGFHVTIQTLLASTGVDTNTTSGNVIHFAVEAQR